MGLRPAADLGALGVHRVIEPLGALPQAAHRLDPLLPLRDDEVRIAVSRLNLDAASYRQLHAAHGGDGQAIRDAVCTIINERGKMHNPVTGSGGMLIGTVEEAGPRSPLGLSPGDRVATLVSLTLTPLHITDGLRRWNGLSEQVPAAGHAVLFGRSVAAKLPPDLPEPLAMAVLDVCGAAALTRRVVASHAEQGAEPVVCVIGASGKSGSLALAAARRAGAGHTIGVVPTAEEEHVAHESRLSTAVVRADARDALDTCERITRAGGPADVTVVCTDVPGCEQSALLATRDGGTVIFFSMATSFSAAALGAEGLAADVTMLIGSGYSPGHADQALELLRSEPGVATVFRHRLATGQEPSVTTSTRTTT